MAKVNLCILMAICMKDIGLMIKLTAKVFTFMQTELGIKELGKMIFNMVEVKKVGLMALLL